MPSSAVKTYIFRVELAGSENPVITRTFSLPASSPFERLHHAIQFCFGWRNQHLHEFNFRTGGADFFDARTVFLRLGRPHPDDIDNSQFGVPPIVDEKTVRLKDIWGENGKYRSQVQRGGQISPLWYTYDFGDNWEHQIFFVGARDARKKRFKLLEAAGGSPLEDCGGVFGWQEIKEAFAASHPTREQRERKEWCFSISSKGRSFNPTTEPNFDEMNNFGLFERYARAYHSGETDDEDDESGARNSDSNDTAAPPRSLQDILSDSAVAGLPALPFPDDINELINGGPPIENAAAKRQFVPPAGTTSPADLFKPMMNACTVPGPRWIYHDPATGVNSVLIFTGGLALNDGQENARAGYSVIFRPDARVEIGQALEFVPGYALTQDRAHLRAAVAALRLRYWAGEGFWRIVIGATSEYVVQNAGERLERWRANRWKYSNGRAVKNKDLWMLLLEELELFERKGVSVQFYLLDAQSAARVMKVAKRGATSNKIPIELTDVLVAAC